MDSKRVENEYNEIVASNSWLQIYQRISRKCHSYPYTCSEARKPQNKPLNRYRDVNPYDHSRVILQRSDNDYINANFVKMERANRQYILTQGPLVFTVSHFWAMVWEQNTRAIIMLNKIIEKNEMKCYWYWPQTDADDNKLLMDVNLLVEQSEEHNFRYYTTRLFKLTDTKTDETRIITHFHYTTWPDFEVPSSPVAFLEFLDKVRASGALEPDVGPAIVHCSAGIGRSGTFCLVDIVLLLIEKEGQANVDIQEILLEMRKYRMGLIQTSDQLRFSYQAIIEGIKRLDPNYKPPEMDESLYSTVAEDEEAPPPPPPRGESLGRPPARPLPAIPTSTSLGNFPPAVAPESSESEEEAPTIPPRDTHTPVSVISSGDEEEEKELIASPGDANPASELRRRKQRELSERVARMRKHAHDADRWHSFKRLKWEIKSKKEKRED